MKKDNIRDYVVSMFRFYSQFGEPSLSDIEQLRFKLSLPEINDLIAVYETITNLDKTNSAAVKYIRCVYFTEPTKPLRRQTLTKRVTNCALKNYITEDVVWKNLRQARTICADLRGLSVRKNI